LLNEKTDNIPTVNLLSWFFDLPPGPPAKMIVDYIIVRKYTPSEPTIIFGTQIPTTGRDFTLAHLTDIHIGYYVDPSGMENSVDNFTDTLQAVKSAHPDRILITGDLVEYDNKDFFMAFKNLLRDFSIPVNTTPGNHDRRNILFGGDDLSDYNTYINPINNPSNPEENNYSFDFNGYRFIGLDSGADYSASYISASEENINISADCPSPYICDNSPESKGLSDDQMQRLRSSSEFNSSAPKIVFIHHPIMNFNNDNSPPNIEVPGIGRIVGPVPPDGVLVATTGDRFQSMEFYQLYKRQQCAISSHGSRP